MPEIGQPVARFCMYCGFELADIARFCPGCGQPRTEGPRATATALSPVPTQWEYEDKVIDFREDKIKATLGTQVTRAGARIEWWSHLRSYVYDNIHKWEADGWELVGAVGPECFVIDQENKISFLTGGPAIFNPNTVIQLLEFRVQMRRSAALGAQARAEAHALEQAAAEAQARAEAATPPGVITPARADACKVLRISAQLPHAIESLAFTADSRTLIVAGGRTPFIWPLDGSPPRKARESHSSDVGVVGVSANGMIVTGTYNGGIALWQLDEGSLSLIRVLQAPHGFAAAAAVTEIDFPSDGKLLASGGYEPQLCLWHVADGAPLHQLKPHGKYVTGITFAPDGATIASSDLAGKIRLWSVSEGALLQTLDAEKELTDLIYGTDGNQLLAAASDQSIQIWDVAPSQCVAALQTGLKHRIHMALSPNRRVLACASYHENNVQLWDVVQGRLLHTLQRHTAPIKTVAFSPDGRLLASGGDGGTVLIWGLE